MWARGSGNWLDREDSNKDDDPNVRGSLGLRVGTSMPVWTGTTMEPFVLGSLWGNLSDDNQPTLVSTGTTFKLEDNLQDVWGEVSAGGELLQSLRQYLSLCQGRCHLRRRP